MSEALDRLLDKVGPLSSSDPVVLTATEVWALVDELQRLSSRVRRLESFNRPIGNTQHVIRSAK